MRTSMIVAVLAGLASPAWAQGSEGDPDAGRELATRWCSSCHVVEPGQRTAANDAIPSFASVARLPSTTSISIHAFLSTPHPPMPDLRLSRTQIDDVTAYILSLRRP